MRLKKVVPSLMVSGTRIVVAVIFALGMLQSQPRAWANDNLAPTPPMGWNSWNHFVCGVNEKSVEQTASALVSSGMKAAGYVYVNLDDCWLASGRDASGNLVPDPVNFPSGMPSLVNYVHSLGLKIGLYEDAGTATCAGRPGSFGHYTQDAATFATWGIDYLKIDWCGSTGLDPSTQYTQFAQALRHANPNIVLSVCDWGTALPWKWAPQIANQWRISTDLKDNWAEMVNIMEAASALAPFAGPGAWNDPDMLQVGNGGMTDTENRTHFSMWSMLAAPLIATNDVTTMSAATLSTLTNPEVIGVDQDSLGMQGILLADGGGKLQTWIRQVSDGTVVALVNLSTSPTTMTFYFGDVGLGPTQSVTVRDLWAQADLGNFAGSISGTVASHGVLMLKLSANIVMPNQTVYEADAPTNRLSGRAVVRPCPPTFGQSCLDGSEVTKIGGTVSDSVTIAHIQAATSGLYYLTVYSTIQGTGVYEMSVNGGPSETLAVTNTSITCCYTIPSTTGAVVELNAGDNSITFSNSNSVAPDLDHIVVTPKGSGVVPASEPIFSVPPGAFASPQVVTIYEAIPNAVIYFTTDGSTPTTSSPIFNSPITVASTETIRAFATANGYSESSIATAVYTIGPPAAPPYFSLAGGTYQTPQTLTLTDSTANATIYFTTDGSTPTVASTVYTGPITIISTQVVKAAAIAPGFSLSSASVKAYTYVPQAAAKPSYSLAGGTYTTAQSLILTDSTPAATIYYTTDGSTPTTSSNVYSGPISISSTETINAIGIAIGYSTSPVATATYSITPTVATPILSLPTGTYTTPQTVSISDSTPGATIYYTTNGTSPTTSSTLYGGPLTVSTSETLEAVAAASGFSTSGLASAAYTINLAAAATPTFSPEAGTYSSGQVVTISDATTGATIYYTTDGTTPTTSSTLYGTPISVSSTETIKAMAMATGYSQSTTASSTYTIHLPSPSFSIAGTAVVVSQGATHGNTSTINIQPMNGFSGPVALTALVTSSPNGAHDTPTLSFGTTTPVAITGTNAGTGTLTISTTAATSAALNPAQRRGSGLLGASSAVFACLVMTCLPFRRKKWPTLLGAALLLIALSNCLTACGGGGGGAGGGPSDLGTMRGNYTITVTGTSGGLSESGTVTLTVN